MIYHYNLDVVESRTTMNQQKKTQEPEIIKQPMYPKLHTYVLNT